MKYNHFGDYMYKFILILCSVLALLNLSACNVHPMKEYPKPVIVLPYDEMAETVNGYKTDAPEPPASESNSSSSLDSSPTEGKFIGNKSSKKFHTRDCRYAKNMKEENMVIFDDLDAARSAGYTACSVCSN